jgi:aminoglycoside phosphotransferase (APT) family kinase protein
MSASKVQDLPTQAFIDEMRSKYPTERETDELLVRKLERRRTETERYRPSTLDELVACANAFLDAHLDEPFEVREPRWLAGGASKLQMLFDLVRSSGGNARHDLVVVRMDPEESHNATSRVREGELLRAFEGVVPVPHVYFVDANGEWFPQPALIYSYAHGVTKPRSTTSGAVSGLGTAFGPELRALLAPQFVGHLAKIHRLEVHSDSFTTMEPPETGTTEAARWQLNRARRVWEEDGAEQSPLMEVATNWLERNLPDLDHVSVVHGDYRSGNFLFDEESGRITAWLDWERGHLGDRHRDLAWTTQAMFGYPDEDGDGYLICGLLPEDDFYETYSRLSGLTVDPGRLRWYSILNCYQVLVTTLGSCYRVVRLGKNHQPALLTVLKAEAAMCADRLRLMLEKVV